MYCEVVLQFVRVDGLLLDGSPAPLDEDIVEGSPRPSLDILILASVRVVILDAPAHCDLWSVFTILGLPYLAMASLNASTPKLAPSVLESRQTSTLRVAQSMLATRYRNPRRTEISIIFVDAGGGVSELDARKSRKSLFQRIFSL